MPEQQNNSNWFKWLNYVKEEVGVKNYIKQLVPQYVLIIIPILLSLPNWIANFWGITFLIIIFFVLIAFQTFLEYKNDIEHVQKIQQLEEEIERARQEKRRLENENEFYALTIEDNQKYFLIMLYRKLGLTESDRISLYYRNSIDKDFEIVARYSTSNRFKEHSRPSYPHDQGYISKCWETKDDDFYVDDIPEESYTVNIDYFAGEMNMDPETLRHLKMQSRAFYIKNVKDKNRDKSIGVIVIESINSKIANLNEKQLKNKLDSDTMEYLYQLMDNKLRGN
ncbi:hypothetical protein [Streptococcus sanguinis]|jgi:hypothetical protein|uniref:Uncharacterized protein n=1 Tax=Streptococcus sanguinis SK115 TaxID=888810 RepID=F0IAG7_STRSA|nr:hypothetical protein [Streptococcus sanguinis]EGD31125.1 hypothetical protein HMPREF9382_1802 [Streptococcus sanguinis SK115]MBZ2054042.1 hypothetical protein [Streptococcus sanguinis]